MSDEQTGHRGLEQRVLARWRQLSGRAAADVIVGFSGGPDSLTLAALLGRLAILGGPRPTLIQVDHAWRSDSAAEQERAAALARSLGLPFQGYRVRDNSFALHPGVGREEAARRERFRIFAEAARTVGTDLVVLAHHQDDQAETVLLHLLRGAGLSGVSGMREATRLVVPWWTREPGAELLVWRPFLTESRQTVRAYGGAVGLAPITDPSNDDPSYRRNAIRHQALPVLEQIVPGAAAALARFAGLAAEDCDTLSAIADAVLASAVSDTGELHRAPIMAQPVAVRRRVVRRWVERSGGLTSLTAERTDAMLTLLANGEPGRRLEIGEGMTVTVTRAGLRLS